MFLDKHRMQKKKHKYVGLSLLGISFRRNNLVTRIQVTWQILTITQNLYKHTNKHTHTHTHTHPHS